MGLDRRTIFSTSTKLYQDLSGRVMCMLRPPPRLSEEVGRYRPLMVTCLCSAHALVLAPAIPGVCVPGVPALLPSERPVPSDHALGYHPWARYRRRINWQDARKAQSSRLPSLSELQQEISTAMEGFESYSERACAGPNGIAAHAGSARSIDECYLGLHPCFPRRWSVPTYSELEDLLDGRPPENGHVPCRKASSMARCRFGQHVSSVSSGTWIVQGCSDATVTMTDTVKWCEPSLRVPEFRVDEGDVFIVRWKRESERSWRRAGLAASQTGAGRCIYPDRPRVRLRFDRFTDRPSSWLRLTLFSATSSARRDVLRPGEVVQERDRGKVNGKDVILTRSFPFLLAAVGEANGALSDSPSVATRTSCRDALCETFNARIAAGKLMSGVSRESGYCPDGRSTMFDEANTVEAMVLDRMTRLGWAYIHGPSLERSTSDVLLESVLAGALVRLNPDIAAQPRTRRRGHLQAPGGGQRCPGWRPRRGERGIHLLDSWRAHHAVRSEQRARHGEADRLPA